MIFKFKAMVVVWICGLIAGQALALDMVQEALGQKITDNQITIGRRTVQLANGNWSFVAKSKSTVINTGNNQTLGETVRVYAIDTQEGNFQSGVEFLLPVASVNTGTAGWVHQPCKAEGFLYREDFNSSFKEPECLLVYKRASHLSRPSGEFYPQVATWVNKDKINLPGPTYEIIYAKYAFNDYGLIRLWVPVKNVLNDDVMVEWAKGLSGSLKNLFEFRDSRATLPKIPSN